MSYEMGKAAIKGNGIISYLYETLEKNERLFFSKCSQTVNM